MSTLKELTAEKHREAETQPFIKSIFMGEVDVKKYTSYLFQLRLLYLTLEVYGDALKIFSDMEDLKRTKYIEMDMAVLASNLDTYPLINDSTWKYIDYLKTIKYDKEKLMAHIYVRHMGDLFGGQQLAKLLPGPNNMYKFDNIPELITKIRSKIDVSMANEANLAFQYNIDMIKDYNE